MREIKFRGKSKDTGKWVYGCYTYSKKTNRHLIWIQSEDNTEFWHTCPIEVDPSTVGQHIGVRDKNGTDVFDGDLIQDANGKLYRIIWGNDLMWLAVTNEKQGNCYSPKVLIRRGAVVIGNIHDNPELMQS